LKEFAKNHKKSLKINLKIPLLILVLENEIPLAEILQFALPLPPLFIQQRSELFRSAPATWAQFSKCTKRMCRPLAKNAERGNGRAFRTLRW
jgi:hypothetical protein